MQISQVGSNSVSPPMQGEVPTSRTVLPEIAKTSAAAIEMPSRAVEAAKEAVDPASLKQATEQLNRAIKLMANNLQFTIDEDTGINVVKVVDTETKEVIRQFPSEEILAIARAFDKLQGMLVRDKA